MTDLNPDTARVDARIVFWGIRGAGVTTNLRVIHEKLRADHRGELQSVPTRIDPTTSYDLLPIEVGKVQGRSMQLQVVAVPGGAEHAPTRKQLLDRIDGLVFVADSRPERVEANLESAAELRAALEAYGCSLDELPVVVQYNRRDESNSYAIEELHRKLAIPGAAVFEAVASEGLGVLQTLTTISKRVVRVLRESQLAPELRNDAGPSAQDPIEMAPAPKVAPLPADIEVMERAILGEAEADDPALGEATRDAQHTVDTTQQALDRPWDSVAREIENADDTRLGPDFEIVSVGEATVVSPHSLEVPVVLGNSKGKTTGLRLRVALDHLLERREE